MMLLLLNRKNHTTQSCGSGRKTLWIIIVIFIFFSSCKESKITATSNDNKIINNNYFVNLKDSSLLKTIIQYKDVHDSLFNNEDKLIVLKIFESPSEYVVLISYEFIVNFENTFNNYYTVVNNDTVIIRLAGSDLLIPSRDVYTELIKNNNKYKNYNYQSVYHSPITWKYIKCKMGKENYNVIKDEKRYEDYLFDLLSDSTFCTTYTNSYNKLLERIKTADKHILHKQ